MESVALERECSRGVGSRGYGFVMDADTKVRLLRAHCAAEDVQLYLRRHAQGKSLRTLAQLYRHLEGENGVQERLNEIEMTLQQAIRDEGAHAGAKVGAIADMNDAERDDNSGGIPIRSVPTGSLNGAGAAPAEPRSATPPNRTAPAHSSGPDPTRPDHSPLSPPGRRPPVPAANGSRRPKGGYDDLIVNFLVAAGEPRKQNDLCVELGIPRGSITDVVNRLERSGRVVARVHHGCKWLTPAGQSPGDGAPPWKHGSQAEVVTKDDVRGVFAAVRKDVEALFDRLERLL